MAKLSTLESDRPDEARVIADYREFQLVRQSELGIAQLITRCFDASEHDKLESLIEERLPRTVNTVLDSDSLSVASIAPGQWYVIGAEQKIIARQTRWSQALTGQTALCLNMSDQLAVLQLSGSRTPELMSSLMPIDFGVWANDTRSCLRTAMSNFSVFIERPEAAGSFRLIVDQSYCDIACTLLCDAANGRLVRQ